MHSAPDSCDQSAAATSFVLMCVYIPVCASAAADELFSSFENEALLSISSCWCCCTMHTYVPYHLSDYTWEQIIQLSTCYLLLINATRMCVQPSFTTVHAS